MAWRMLISAAGHADDLPKKLLAEGSIVASDLHSGNCMHPACLRASLEQSLATLNVETVGRWKDLPLLLENQ
jgi:hypothetical protein